MKNILYKLFSGAFLAFAVMATSQPFIASSAIPQANATGNASLNQDANDFPVIEVSNYSRCPNNSSCWTSAISGVRAGETIAFVMYAHNTGDADAMNTRISLELAENGSLMNGYARISADNASQVAGNARVSFDSSVTTPVSLTFVGGEYYKQSSVDPLNPDSLPGGQSVRQVAAGGVNIGTLPADAPGTYANDVQLVVRYRVDGEAACHGTATLNVTPSSDTVNVGETAQFRAVYDSNGNCDGGQTDVTNSASWSSSNTSVASSLGAGRFRGNAQGTATVRASYSGLSDTATLYVQGDAGCQSDGATLEVSPDSATISVGQTQQYQAVYDSNGSCEGGQTNVTGSASWTSNNTNVASSLGGGRFRGNSEGTTTVRASYNGLSDTATLTVRQDACQGTARLEITPSTRTIDVGQIASYTATYDSNGNCDGGTSDVTDSASWSIDNASIATNLDDGRFRGVREGSTTVRASFSGSSASASLTVRDDNDNECTSRATLEVTPNRETVDVGETADYTATYDENGDCSGGRRDVTDDATWSVDSSSIASNLGDGEFRGRREGSTTVRASFNGESDAASLRVNDDNDNDDDDDDRCDNERASLVIVPFQATFSVGQTFRYRALYDSDGPGCSDNGDRDVSDDATWSSNSSGIATSLGDGDFRGVSGGSTSLTARFQGITANAQANVVGTGGPNVVLPPTVIGGGTITLPPTFVGGGVVQGASITAGVDSASVACITVTPSVDVTMLLPNQQFIYTTLYRNDCPFALNSAVLRVFIPNDVEFIASSNPFFLREGQKFSYNLGILPPGGQGSVAITGFVRKDAQIGDTETFTSSIEFLDGNGRIQSATSYLVAVLGGDIRRTLTASIGSTLGRIFGGGLGWVLLLLVILAGLAWFIWTMVTRRRDNNPTTNVVVAKDEDPLRALRNA